MPIAGGTLWRQHGAMSLATCYSRAQSGLHAPLVTVEVHLSGGLPSFNIVGLPETEVKEARDRVRAALINASLEFPASRVTVNLAPAELPKEGGRFDLAIAIGILAASHQLPGAKLEDYEFAGELALSGAIRPIRGALNFARASDSARRTLILPLANGAEAALIDEVDAYTARHLLEVLAHFRGRESLPRVIAAEPTVRAWAAADLSDVKGQAHAKRALEVAAAGGHNLLMIGPPGTGKSMLAARLPGILPPMPKAAALEAAAVQSISTAGLDLTRFGERPYRAPHHTASAVALVGGGSDPKPGEISLAHEGVLFLDELPEFQRQVLEVLREPLESGKVSISRAARQAEFPARFMLIAAMNPCQIGCPGAGPCRCNPQAAARYRNRISGPLLDRIDIQITVPRLPLDDLRAPAQGGETSAQVRLRTSAARACQLARSGVENARLSTKQIERDCALTETDGFWLTQAISKLGLSARAYHRILKLARTIADLAEAESIERTHLLEAISYRRGLELFGPGAA